jgi:hypothetical protein
MSEARRPAVPAQPKRHAGVALWAGGRSDREA